MSMSENSNGSGQAMEKETMSETLKRHQEMFQERIKLLERWGTLSYKEVLDRVNDPALHRRSGSWTR